MSLTIETIIKAILSLVIIALMGGVISHYLFSEGGGFFEVIDTANESAEFKPYVIEHAPEEQKIVDSVDALMCALNKVGSKDPQSVVCKSASSPPAKKEATTGAAILNLVGLAAATEGNTQIPDCEGGKLYGETCMICSSGADAKTLNLKGNRKLDADVLAQAAIACSKKTNALGVAQYCAKVVWPSGFLATANNRFSATDIGAAIDKKGSEVKYGGEATLAVGDLASLPFFICGKGDGTVQFTRAPATYCGPDASLENKATFCTIKNFQLPQKIDTSPADFILGYGDPEYLLYYGAFPEGEDIYWQAHSSQFYYMGAGFLIVGGFLDYFTAGAASDVAEIAAKNIVKELAEEGAEVVVKRAASYGAVNAVKSLAIEQGLQNIHGIGPVIAREITESVFEVAGKNAGKELTKEAQEQIAKRVESIVFSKVNTVPKKLADGGMDLATYRQSVVKSITQGSEDFSFKMGSETSYKGITSLMNAKLTKQEIQEHFREKAFQNFFKKFLLIPEKITVADIRVALHAAEDPLEHSMDDVLLGIAEKRLSASGKLNEEGLIDEITLAVYDKTFSGKSLQFEKLVSERAEKIAADGITNKDWAQTQARNEIMDELSQRYAATLLSSAFKLDKEAILQTAETSVASLLKLPYKDQETALKRAAGILESITKKTASGTVGYRPGMTAAELFSRQVPIAFPSASSLAHAAAHPATGIPHTLISSGKGLPSWFWNHRYPLAVLLIYAADQMDSINEKKLPVGENTIVIKKPSVLGPKVSYTLDKNLRKYFLTNVEKTGSRLHFVSPCKATLSIKKTTCTCDANPLNARYNFGGGTIDVMRGTMDLDVKKLEAYAKEQYKDAAPELQKQMIVSYTNFYEFLNSPESAVATKTETWLPTVLTSRGTLGDIAPEEFFSETMDRFVDTTDAVKVCDQYSVLGNTFSTYKELGGTGLSAASDPNFKPEYQTQCITVDYQEEDAEGSNYCIGDYPNAEAARKIVGGLGLAVNIGLTVYSGGAWAIVGAGAAQTAIDQSIAYFEKWPV